MHKHKIIQKDYTFDTTFNATIFNYRKIIQALKNGEYDLVDVETTWSIRRPFRITVIAIIKVVEEIDLVEIRHNRSQIFLDEKQKNLENENKRKHNDI